MATLTPPHLPAPAGPSRVLVVEDEEALRRAYSRILSAAGHEVTQAANGREATEALERQSFDVIVSDLSMPELNGLQLLRAVRTKDLDVPVILVTANPSVESAAEALELGALRYLVKPVPVERLVATVEEADRLHRIARLKRQAAEWVGASDRFVGDRAGLEASFARALGTLWMAYQPIVHVGERRIEAYEALVRTREPSIPHPGALLSAAATLGQMQALGRAIRSAVAATLRANDPGTETFINLHADDLADESLYDPAGPLVPFASRIVLEVTERAALDEQRGVAERIASLRRLGFRIAIDDLGAGYAGLNYFALLNPDVVKIDMALVRGVDADPVKQKLFGMLAGLCQELRIRVVAEGVETRAEAEAIEARGCRRMQGYLFARPAPAFPSVSWDATSG